MAAQVAALGLTPVIAPLLHKVSITPDKQASAPDTIIATSQQVTTFAAEQYLAFQPVIFTVGARTQKAFQQAGFHDVRAADGDVASLLALLQKNTPQTLGRILYLRAEQIRHEITPLLTATGFSVSEQVCYAMQPVCESCKRLPAIDEFWQNPAGGVVTLFSARTAQVLYDYISQYYPAETAQKHRVLCFAPSVLNSVRFLPWGGTAVCESARMACMLSHLPALCAE